MGLSTARRHALRRSAKVRWLLSTTQVSAMAASMVGRGRAVVRINARSFLIPRRPWLLRSARPGRVPSLPVHQTAYSTSLLLAMATPTLLVRVEIMALSRNTTVTGIARGALRYVALRALAAFYGVWPSRTTILQSQLP